MAQELAYSSADNLGVLWNIMNDFQAGDKKTIRAQHVAGTAG